MSSSPTTQQNQELLILAEIARLQAENEPAEPLEKKTGPEDKKNNRQLLKKVAISALVLTAIAGISYYCYSEPKDDRYHFYTVPKDPSLWARFFGILKKPRELLPEVSSEEDTIVLFRELTKKTEESIIDSSLPFPIKRAMYQNFHRHKYEIGNEMVDDYLKNLDHCKTQTEGVIHSKNFTYEGPLHNCQAEGIGRLLASDRLYKGDFKNGLPHGEGILKHASLYTYKGKFENGQPVGIGKALLSIDGLSKWYDATFDTGYLPKILTT